MATRILAGLAGIIVIAMGAALWHRGRQLEAATAAARADAFVRDSLEATVDSLETVAAVADSGRVAWERRARQGEIERDRLDVRRRLEQRAAAELEAELRALHATIGGRVATDPLAADVRLVESVVRQPPFTVAIDGRIAPDTARLSVSVRVDPVTLAIGFRCGEAGADGIRPAHVTAEGPDWLRIARIRGVVDPDACNPAPPAVPRPARWPTVLAVAVGAGVGAIVADNPVRGAAAGAGAGLGVDVLRRGVVSLAASAGFGR